MRCVAWLLIALMALGPASAVAQETGGKKYLSIDYREFPTFGAAIKNSLAPTDIKANVGAALRNTVDPLNPARYVAAVLVYEAQRQLASGQGLDVGKLVSGLSVPSIALGYVGAQAGDIAGAALTSIMANTMGMAGGIAGGFVLRPILWFLGNQVGQTIGGDLKNGDVSVSRGFGKALVAFNPVEDSSQMIGDAVFSVLGQALIPIPLVGAMVGGMVGGTIGLLAGKAFVGTEAGQAVDRAIRGKLGNLANSMSPGTGDAAADHKSTGPAAPSTAASAPLASALPVAAKATVEQPLTAAGRAAYQSLLEAMKSGDKARIQEAFGQYQKAR